MSWKKFLKAGCVYGILSLISTPYLAGQTGDKKVGVKKIRNMPQGLNTEQVKRIIKFIDSSQSESVKESIFNRLGYECFYSRKLDEWVGKYTGNVQAFLARVNIEKKSKYWERLEFNKEKTILTLTGKEVNGCACAFADCPNPPKSLCYYCCKNFQKELFSKLLGQKVKVEITESFLLGSERCSTLIYLR